MYGEAMSPCNVLYCLGLSKDLEDKVSRCQVCSEEQAEEPLMQLEPPHRCLSKVGTDIFQLNNQYFLCTADCYSMWVEVDKLENLTSSSSTIKALKQNFSRYGKQMKSLAIMVLTLHHGSLQILLGSMSLATQPAVPIIHSPTVKLKDQCRQ